MFRARMRRSKLIGVIYRVILGLPIAIPLFAFKSPQHQEATQKAIDTAVLNGAIDLGPSWFGPTVYSWSWGTGLGSKPAELLAHNSDQSNGSFKYNGGNFSGLLRLISIRYQTFNFKTETNFNEGSYVLMGACAHLIEDQASMPHGANVPHGLTDQFENLFNVDVALTASHGNVTPDNSYSDSLSVTQGKIPTLRSSSGSRYWLFNTELPGESSALYSGQFFNP